MSDAALSRRCIFRALAFCLAACLGSPSAAATLADDVARSLDQLSASTLYVADYLAVTAETLRIREVAGEISAADRQRGLQAAVAAVRSPNGGASLAAARRERRAAAQRFIAAAEARIGNARWPTDQSAAVYRVRARESLQEARILLAYLTGLDVSLVEAMRPTAEVVGWTQGRLGGSGAFDPLDADIEAATKGVFANLPRPGSAGPAAAGTSPPAVPPLAASTPPAPTTPQAGTGATGVANAGTDGQTLQGTITRTFAGYTAVQCRAACDGDSSCAGWVLVKAGNPNPGCYLMTALTNRVASPCCVSDLKAGQVAGPIAAPAPAPSPGAVAFLGCYKDTADFDLNGYLERSPQNTPQRCIGICQARGFAFAGVQYGESCLCGNRYGKYGAATNCNYPCTGDRGQRCGGYAANGVYRTGVGTAAGTGTAPVAPPPMAGSPPAPGSWTRWISRDVPDGSADWEALADVRGEVPCTKPIAIECRVVSDKRDWRAAGQRYRCSLDEPNPGGICTNADNPPNGCLDYEVRYLCPAR